MNLFEASTSKYRTSTKFKLSRNPSNITDSLIEAWDLSNNNVLTRDFSSFTDYLISQYGNLPTDAKPRGGNAFNPNKGKKGKGKGKGHKGKGKGHKGKGKQDKGKSRGAGRYVYWNADDVPQAKRPRHERQASSTANNTEDPVDPSTPDDTASVRSHTSTRSSASSVNQIHGTNATTKLTSSQTNPDPKLYFYCCYHGWSLSHSGEQCRVMLNDASYSRAHKEAASPANTSPIGNICIELERTGGRTRPYLKAWGTYSRLLQSTAHLLPKTHQSPALPPRVPHKHTKGAVAQHRVFSVYAPTVTFTSDSGATDILMRYCGSHILQNYTAYFNASARPGFDVANYQQIYPIAHGVLTIPNTTITMTAFVFHDDDLHSKLFGVAPLTNQGLSATYTNDDLQITTPTPKGPQTILYGLKEPGDNVW
jgi:hypothetical protein